MTKEEIIEECPNPESELGEFLMKEEVLWCMQAYADQQTSSLSTQLTEMTAEKNRWFDKYTIESQRADILDGELRITQKKLEVLVGMLDK